jgi:hypothetical protein
MAQVETQHEQGQFINALAKLRKANISFLLSVCQSPYVRPSAWNNSAPTGRIFIKFDRCIFLKFVKKVQVLLISHKNSKYLT